MRQLVLLAAAGAIGALSRYALSRVVSILLPVALPLGTWAVNLLGCFLFGLIYVAADEKNLVGPETRFILLVGFVGTFTTFSTYIFDCYPLIKSGQYALVAFNVIGQNILGFVALLAGIAVARGNF